MKQRAHAFVPAQLTKGFSRWCLSILLLMIIQFVPINAGAACVAYMGAYDGVSGWQQPIGTGRDGYNESGVYGYYTCSTAAGESYWSPNAAYVAGSPPAPPPPPAPLSITVYNDTPINAVCISQDGGGGDTYILPFQSVTCNVPVQIGLPQVSNMTDPRYYDQYVVGGATWSRSSPPRSYSSSEGGGNVLIGGYMQNCTQAGPVAPGCPAPTCAQPWGGTVANGSSITAYASSTVPYGSSCSSQVRSCSNGTLSGSYTAQSCSVSPPANCTAQTKSWGAGNICQATTTLKAHGQTIALDNQKPGAVGSANATCSNGTWTVNPVSCSPTIAPPTSVLATDGTVSGKITVTWVAISGATGYDLQYRKSGSGTWTLVTDANSGWEHTTSDESNFEFQVRSKDALGPGVWSATETGYVARSCATATQNWGAGSFCAASATAGASGTERNLTNSTTGATGSATAICTNGTWALSGGSTCATSLDVPASLSATDGTVIGKITVTWAAISGATGYDLQYRKAGDATWTQTTGVNSGWQLTTADDATYEFQLRGKNATGSGDWSATETGYIRKILDPLFVSQTGLPLKIGVGQSFSFSQTWKNNGTETWTGGAHGTAPYNPADTSVWGLGNVAFSGSTATGATVTTNLTLTAPMVPGTYPVQRSFQKSGTAYGQPSTSAEVIVVGPPSCTAVTPNAATTYNPNGTLTVTLQGASSVESASVKAWGEIGAQDDVREYPMSLSGSTWTANIQVANHYTENETKINVQAFVGNSLFTAVSCATSSVEFLQLPVPTVQLTPVLGTSTGGGNQGFVVKRSNGEFAKAAIDLGVFNTLGVKVEILSAADLGVNVGPTQNNISVENPIALKVDDAIKGGSQPAWQNTPLMLRVSYADPDAAAQGKVFTMPVDVTLPPVSMQVTAAGTSTLPAGVNARVHNAGDFSSATYGDFAGALRLQDGTVVRDFEATGEDGSWVVAGLDYGQMYDKKFVAVARVVPPSHVTLLEPMEFLSAPFVLPVQAPPTISATDGTREDDVLIQWSAPAPGGSIRYRLYRDEEEITPVGGVAAVEYIDVPPLRGKEYTYRVKTLINTVTSENQAQDIGFMPACRAMRLIGAGLNADMTAITGMVESWACLEESAAASSINGAPAQDVVLSGAGNYRSFSVPLPTGLADGPHVMSLRLLSKDVQSNADRAYDIAFTLNKASIKVNNLTILYNGAPAADGLEANSIGRFGIKMEGGSGIGFAEEVPQ